MGETMYELIHLKENTYYFECPARVGVYRLDDTHVCLIDSGSTKDAAKRMKRRLDEMGWEVSFILVTHSHADHIGGNAYFQENTGCAIYANGAEVDFAKYTLLNSCFVYGALSPSELRHHFFLAKESMVKPIEEAPLPEGFEVLQLPGHSMYMAGFRTPDNVVFLADSLASEAVIEKYQITFLLDPELFLKTLQYIQTIQADCFVPAHVKPLTDIKELAQKNIQTVERVRDKLCGLCKEPITFDALLKKVFETFSMRMNFEQYTLVGSTVRSYLTWMKETGLVRATFIDNQLFWEAIS